MGHARARNHCIDNPHHNSADEQRQRHHGQALQIFTNQLCRCPRRKGRHHESDHRETYRMSNKVAVTAFAPRKCAEELNDPLPKINRQRQNRAQLDHDRVHLPKTIVEIEIEQRLSNAEMRGRAHGEEFGEPFNDPEQDRQEKIVHQNFFLLP